MGGRIGTDQGRAKLCAIPHPIANTDPDTLADAEAGPQACPAHSVATSDTASAAVTSLNGSLLRWAGPSDRGR